MGVVRIGLQRQLMRDSVGSVERVWRVSHLHSAGSFTDTANGDADGYLRSGQYKSGRSHNHVDGSSKRGFDSRVTHGG